MKRFASRYSIYKDKKNLARLAASVLFLAVSIFATYFAILYATDHASFPVTDIILSNIPTYNVDAIFLYGPVIFWTVIGVYLIFFAPEKIPFSLKTIALFLLIRSAFLCMTHIGPFPSHALIRGGGIIGVFNSGDDLFFSSHTGLPFLMALILWDKKPWRIFCIIGSIFFGIIVLMAHLHYSIDVFAAFFITYAIYRIAFRFLKREKLLFDKHVENDPVVSALNSADLE